MSDPEFDTLSDDIGYLRALATAGAHPPVFGGSVAIAAGLIFSAASIVCWAIPLSRPPILMMEYPAVWAAALTLFFLARRFLLSRDVPRTPSIAGNALSASWVAVGMTSLVLLLALVAAALGTGLWYCLYLYPLVILALYGGGWAIAASMSKRLWVRIVSVTSFGCSIGLGYFAGRPIEWLLYAGALILVVALPGYLAIREQPRKDPSWAS
jgi:hypothetical protein